MLPTIKNNGDVVIVKNLDHTKTFIGRLLFNNKDDDDDDKENNNERSHWKNSPYKVGDIVISYCKDDLDKTVCKRIVAAEGDHVSYSGQGSTTSCNVMISRMLFQVYYIMML